MNQMRSGQLIAQKRKERNLTQEQLAELIGVSNKTISKWERGKCMPDYDVVEALCDQLHITLDQLIKGEEKSDVSIADGEDIRQMLREMRKHREKKMQMSGMLFLAMGVLSLILSQVLGDSDAQRILAGFMLGISLPQLAAGALLLWVVHKK